MNVAKLHEVQMILSPQTEKKIICRVPAILFYDGVITRGKGFNWLKVALIHSDKTNKGIQNESYKDSLKGS